MEKKISLIENWVHYELKHISDSGHDIWHARRVLYNALEIQKEEGGDIIVIEVSALIHDLIDDKFFPDKNRELQIKQKLREFDITENHINQVMNICSDMSFSKELEGSFINSIEYKIVQDADRLDAIGAIGIARAYSYGNKHSRPFFNPEIYPEKFESKENYRKSESPTINHFFEKLLKLKKMMKTEIGKEMAIERSKFMVEYLTQFMNEFGVITEDQKEQWLNLLKEMG